MSKDERSSPKTWNNDLKQWIFDDDVIQNGEDFMSLETPYRALDAAMVPVTINFKFDQDNKDEFIENLTLNC